VTFRDILDSAVFNSGDIRGEYRLRQLGWLNMARAEMADLVGGLWNTALEPEATFELTTGGMTGIHALTGYEFIAGDRIFNITDNIPILPGHLQDFGSADPDKSESSEPMFWADAGMGLSGNRQIQLYPVASHTINIRFPGYKTMTEITDETLDLDPFFGPVLPMAHVFFAGIQYYNALHDDSEAAKPAYQRGIFYDLAKKRHKKAGRLSSASAIAMKNVVRNQQIGNRGRFDPSVYPNHW
jgi:hypothetical protein